MDVFSNVPKNYKDSDRYLLELNKKEARALIEAVQAASDANKRKSSFKTLLKHLEDCLEIY